MNGVVSDKSYWQVYIRPARGRRKDKLLHGRISWEKKTFIWLSSFGGCRRSEENVVDIPIGTLRASLDGAYRRMQCSSRWCEARWRCVERGRELNVVMKKLSAVARERLFVGQKISYGGAGDGR